MEQRSSTPLPLADPVPVVVVDSVRDGWDWLVVWGTAASCMVGLIAVLFAAFAARSASKANKEASKARLAVAHERRRAFELDILRSLAESVETIEVISNLMYNRHLFIAQTQARINLIPEPELPMWRRFIANAPLPESLAESEEERTQLAHNLQRRIGDAGRVRQKARKKLLEDVAVAIATRMAERDD